jgi:outer membrane protein OmpA-like peptidoglycan-associated protein
LVRPQVTTPAALFYGKKWLSIKNTSASHFLDSVLQGASNPQSDYGKTLKPQFFEQQSIAPSELLNQVIQDEDIAAVAIHEPWAADFKHRGFQDITDNATVFPSVKHVFSPHINVFLVNRSVTENESKRKAFSRLIKSLLGFPSDPTTLFDKDPALLSNRFGFNKDRARASDVLQHYRTFTLEDNIKFHYSIGEYGCLKLVTDYLKNDQKQFCSTMINTELLEQILMVNQNKSPIPKLTKAELEKMCMFKSILARLRGSHTPEDVKPVYGFAKGEYSISHAAQGYSIQRQLADLKSELKATSSQSFCLIGHADDLAFKGPDGNRGLGLRRAQQVKRFFESSGFKAEQFITVSMGADVPLPGMETVPRVCDECRRVELWRIPFKFEEAGQ